MLGQYPISGQPVSGQPFAKWLPYPVVGKGSVGANLTVIGPLAFACGVQGSSLVSADPALQGGHQPAHPRLGQAQPFGGPAEVQFLGKNQEDLDLGGIHAKSPRPCA